MPSDIIIKGAREHNLKNIDVVLPRDKLIVITGISGSGKSTLAFDTIYAEGQRRYVESLSAYARQFLGLMNKPDVDSIDGLSPAISIEQKTTTKNPRSTVGTTTEIYDYLRLLFARIGTPHCPNDGSKIEGQTADKITESIMKSAGEKIEILAPIIRQRKGTYEHLAKEHQKLGFSRMRIDGTTYELPDFPKLDKQIKHDIEVIVDRLKIDDRKRLQDSIEQALKLGNGMVLINYTGEKDDSKKDDSKKSKESDKQLKGARAKNEVLYNSKMACTKCGFTFEELQPRMFSFNSPFGACEDCHGLGFKQEFDENLIIPDKSLSIEEGAIKAFGNVIDSWRIQWLQNAGRKAGFSIKTPIAKFTKEQYKILMYGSNEKIKYDYHSKTKDANFSYYGEYEGIIPMMVRLHKQTESEYRREEMEKFMVEKFCETCKGKKLKKEVLAVKLDKKSIMDVTDMSIKDAGIFFKNIVLTEKERFIAKQILKEINARLNFLMDVGLDYLTLARNTGTLSGGEAQRIRLATQIGSTLTGVLYILDEPSIGLHQRDNEKLIATLQRLRDLGNTVIVVEHDEDTMMHADHILDIGPGAGIHGGHVVCQGNAKAIMACKDSLTGQYLSHKKFIEIPKKRRTSDKFITILGARQNNLKNIDVKIPTNTITSITGVSGSGKSTLINDILYKAMMKNLNGHLHESGMEEPGLHKSIKTDFGIDKVINVDQSPIGRTPRSNPATYIKVFDDIRNLFSETKEAKSRGFKPGRFSFNVIGGRCEACHGDGLIKIEMNFLPDVYVTCEECKGTRYNKETLEVTYKAKTISEVLNMTVEEALSFFENVPSIKRKIETLNDVGLEYIKLGQSSTTLSGGEAQRIKLTRELAKRDKGHTLYILDEPTTGLHFADVHKLLEVLNRLVEKQNTVVVIEHNLDVIKTSDYIIDLGPEGGDAGGQIIAEGTPEQVAKVKGSYTGQFLKKIL